MGEGGALASWLVWEGQWGGSPGWARLAPRRIVARPSTAERMRRTRGKEPRRAEMAPLQPQVSAAETGPNSSDVVAWVTRSRDKSQKGTFRTICLLAGRKPPRMRASDLALQNPSFRSASFGSFAPLVGS